MTTVLERRETSLHLVNASKTFGSVTVLSCADFEVGAGEIRALVGRNGSGKSTLVKILAGYHDPDPGASLEIAGRRVEFPAAAGESQRRGAAFVHQDLALIPTMSVVDNLFVGLFEHDRAARISWRRTIARADAMLERLGLTCSARALVGTLGQADRALLAIARALLSLERHAGDGRGLLVLDEPTASLPQHDVDRLFSAIRDVAAGGVGVVYVSHRLGEVFELADTVSVLRDGRLIETVDVGHIDEEQLIELMIGGRLEAYYPERASDIGAAVFEAHGLTGGTVRDFSIELRSGEVVGVTGLNGAGHEELPYLLFGARRASAGRIVIRGRDVAASTITPGAAMGAGVTLLPADRQGASGAQDARVRDNVSLPVLKRFKKRGVMRNGAERRAIDRLLADFSVTPPDGRPFLRQLSGGNQQKALLAKWMQLEPSVLILHEPTQGVDVGSKADIFGRIERAARRGTAVLIASAETEDLAHLCHRVIVLRDGRVAAELAGDALTADRITEHALRTNQPNSHHRTQNGAPDDDSA